jgi:hypothetical protein
MMMIEAHLERPDKFDMAPQEFEELLEKYFELEIADKASAMIQYYLKTKA